jgi:hypothetical protein
MNVMPTALEPVNAKALELDGTALDPAALMVRATVWVAGCPFASSPLMTIEWFPGGVEAGIVTVFDHVPSAATVAVPRSTGAEKSVSVTWLPGSQLWPVSVRVPPRLLGPPADRSPQKPAPRRRTA